MTFDAWLTLGVVGLIVGLLAVTRIAPDVIMIGALTLLLLAGVVPPDQAFAGFANEGVITVAVLYVVSAGLRETGGIALLAQAVLGRPKSLASAQVRMMLPIAGASAFVNNTPLVAMTLPAITDWAKNLRLSPSKFLIPLSYAAILGGSCSLIGTSTNVLVSGMVVSVAHKPAIHMFDIAWVGLPCCLVGLGYMIVAGRWLLPDRRPAFSAADDPRAYTVEMLVEAGSALVGKTVEAAGLRHLPGMYLMEIERQGDVLAAVGPQEKLRENDRLIFVGIVESVVDLQKIRGLRPATNQVFKLDSPRSQRCLVEAVVSDSCPIVGQTIRDGRFRTVYNAAVIAVSRNGERIAKKIGDIVLRTGDTLLLEAHPAFVTQQRNSRDFYLVSSIEDSRPPRHDRAWVGIGILVTMVAVITAGWLTTLQAALLAAGLMIATRCCSSTAARRSLDWSVLIAIGASLGIGKAIESTGMAEEAAARLIGLGGDSPWTALAIVYVIGMVFTELLTNNAAAALVFPIAMATAENLGVSYMPFIICLMISASCGFATPIGYQTHLMVYGPGGYRFSDFIRFGLPLDLLMGIVAVAITPLVWPF